MPLFKRRFPRKASKETRLARAMEIHSFIPPHPIAFKRNFRQAVKDLRIKDPADFPTVREEARQLLGEFNNTAKQRSRKATLLLNARRIAHAAKGGFVVKRKK